MFSRYFLLLVFTELSIAQILPNNLPVEIGCIYPYTLYNDPFGCDCYNRELRPLCKYPASWNSKTCNCVCPWWASSTCPPNKYLDETTCQCKCKETCQSCTQMSVVSQVWNEDSCSCVCPRILRCRPPRYFDYQTCACQCKQWPRICCLQPFQMWRIWSDQECGCVCLQTQSCATFAGYYWDKWLCQCVPFAARWYSGINYAEEILKIQEGSPSNIGAA